jgi:hypothetical protein
LDFVQLSIWVFNDSCAYRDKALSVFVRFSCAAGHYDGCLVTYEQHSLLP